MRRHGFTLIELLSVMAVMMILTGAAVAGYFGMMRGAGIRTGSQHLISTLSLARQMAIMGGRSTYVIFKQEKDAKTSDVAASYVIVQQQGTGYGTSGSGGGASVLRDDYANWKSGDFAYTPMYNLSNLKLKFNPSLVKSNTRNQVVTYDAIWTTKAGQRIKYGWGLQPGVPLPRGVQFGDKGTAADTPDPIVFKPDGMTDKTHEIEIYEMIQAGNRNVKHKKITVEHYGFVKDEWTS